MRKTNLTGHEATTGGVCRERGVRAGLLVLHDCLA